MIFLMNNNLTFIRKKKKNNNNLLRIEIDLVWFGLSLFYLTSPTSSPTIKLNYTDNLVRIAFRIFLFIFS